VGADRSGLARVPRRESADPTKGTYGTTVQKYGWYGQFIVAYIDGGYIPVEDGPHVAGSPTTRMRAQRLYLPRSTVIPTDASGNQNGSPSPGAYGNGYGRAQADRFNDPDHVFSGASWDYSLSSPTKSIDLRRTSDDPRARELDAQPATNLAASPTPYTPVTTVVPSTSSAFRRRRRKL